jgi:hypothetical protein
MGFFDKTYVTNVTGLGDDQMEELTKNQGNVEKNVKSGFKQTGKDFDTVFDKFKKSKGYIEDAEKGINKNTNTGFTNLSESLSGYGDTLTKGQTDAAAGRAKYYNDMLTALKNNTGGLATQASLDTGFSDATGRFDTLDTSVGNVQNTADTISTDVGNVQTTMDTGFVDAGTRFDTLDTGQTDAATTAEALSGQLTDTQKNVLGGQGELQGSLDTMSDTANTYAGESLTNQGDIQSTVDGFKTSFDTYVDRYGEDTTLANSARSDLATAQANQTDRLREDLGEYAQANAAGQGNIAQTIGTLGTGIDVGFKSVGSAIGTGFSETSLADQTAAENLSTRLGNVRNLIQNSTETLEAGTKDQYLKLTTAFDQNGRLIANSIDEQGNTITRTMDEQGIIVERKIDANGNELSAVSMDVETMLGNAEAYEQSLMRQIDRRFDNAEENTKNELGAIARGFTQQDKKMDTQARDLASIAAEQTDIDINMRNEFKQLSQAFDDQGNLISNSVLDNGTTISRAIDENGNLLLRSFDATGERVGDQVMNINRSLTSLSQLRTIQGGNISMGNLSPAMTSSAPSTGFTSSPYATTR